MTQYSSSPGSLSRLSTISLIRADLAANSYRKGLGGFVTATLFNPGFSTILRHRLVASISRRGPLGSLLGRWIWRAGVRKTACHIHWRSRIGPGLALPHPTGIVIGEGVQVGARATIYQHVTLGTNRKGGTLYPVIGDNVILYAGSAVIGSATVGSDSIIGANVVIHQDVDPGMSVTGKETRPLQERTA
ncbi:serine O-acetyltransferase [Sphingosinithalassobacter portus]|uniref:serine O-acetyltransferase n=1 Tax=Stakelama portus TaxID=2676234 RepID=UPI000D6DD008|nr:serine acetyltransferase [Sphingosinithalassobacter portus]